MSAPSISMTGTHPVSTTRSWTRDIEGTFTLVTFILRQERKRLLIWFLVIVGMLFAFESFISDLTATTEGVEDIKRFMQGATGALFGPGYGRFEPTAERYLAGVYSSWVATRGQRSRMGTPSLSAPMWSANMLNLRHRSLSPP